MMGVGIFFTVLLIVDRAQNGKDQDNSNPIMGVLTLAMEQIIKGRFNSEVHNP
jgi:hypothetical protein